MSTQAFQSDNVLLITFGDDPANDNKSYEALTALKQLDEQDQIKVTEGAVISREVDGSVDIKSQVGHESYVGTASGGIVGLLIGILGGPFGVLLGGATGLLVGSLFDLDDEDDTQSVLTEFSKNLHPTRTAVLAEVSEPGPEVVDNAMGALGGTVLREPVADVEEEIAAAQDAQRKAKKEARTELHKAQREKRSKEAHEKVEALKAKLHKQPAKA